MAEYEDRLKDLTSLDDDGLSQLQDELKAAFNTADEADDLDEMASVADALESVRAEIEGRGGSAAPAEPEPEPEVEAEAEPDGDEDEEVVAASAAPTEQQTEADDAVVASGESDKEAQVEIPEDRKPVTASAATVVTAGADIPGKSAGTAFVSMDEVSQAYLHRIQSLRGVRSGDGEQVIIASVATSVPEDRVLRPGDLEGNQAKIRKVTDVDSLVASGEYNQAMVAAGGYCAPLEVRYDIFGVGDADRPVRDGLAGFVAERGGIRYSAPPLLGDFTGATGVWTAATDANPGANVKAKLAVACAPELTATLDAVTLQLQFGNLQSRAYPELIARNNELGLVAHARLAEQTLLTKMDAASTAVTTAKLLGVARDFLFAIGRAAAAYRSRHRISRRTPLRVMAPEWVLDMMREDLSMGLPGDKIGWADQEITGYLNERNVSVTWHMEQPLAAQAAGALNAFPATFKWNLFAEGTFLFLDGGTLDLGIVRDSTLVSTNDYVSFSESFEGLAKVGSEALSITSTVAVTGEVAATTDTTPV